MLDINLIRKNPDEVKDGIKKKNYNPSLVDNFLTLDREWRELTKEIDDLRAKQKELSEKRDIDGSARLTINPERSRRIEEAQRNKEKIKDSEATLKILEEKRESILFQIPNLPLPEVPAGKNESENVVLREVGKKPEFSARGGDFQPKDHLELGKALDILDFETGSKVAGSGFYFLKNEGALLELALVRYALDFLAQRGFTLWITPDLAHERFYLGTGYLPRGPEAHIYELKNFDLGLIGTAEVALVGIHADEIMPESDLPKLYAGYSHCFRQEAGAYGKYSKGLYRVHQFTKVEMFAYAKPEDSPKIHEEFLNLEEELWQGLKIPYRVVEMCAGELGAQPARKFDLEAWMPGRGDWGEVTSASNTTDYQARNLGIRYRDKNGNIDFVHTLNGTAIATSRAIVAILENYQQKDGRVLVPKSLQKYMGIKEIKAG